MESCLLTQQNESAHDVDLPPLLFTYAFFLSNDPLPDAFLIISLSSPLTHLDVQDVVAWHEDHICFRLQLPRQVVWTYPAMTSS